MEFLITVIILAGCSIETTQSKAIFLQPPRDLQIEMPNLNCRVTWQPPSDVTNQTVYTTRVSYYRTTWFAVPGCVNIKRTQCSNLSRALNEMDIDDGGGGETDPCELFYVRVMRRESGSDKEAPSNDVEIDTFTEATVGAPTIDSLRIASTSIEVDLLAPETPFKRPKTGRYLRMDDKDLGCIPTVRYNYTLRPLLSNDVVRNAAVEKSSLKEGRVRTKHTQTNSVKMISLPYLQPDTSYLLVVQAKLGSTGSYSADNLTVVLSTSEAAPSLGSRIQSVDPMEPDCNQPDKRNVTISWKPPDRQDWNSRRIHYEIRAQPRGFKFENVTRVVTSNRLDEVISETLNDLDRWVKYAITVYTSNTAGGTPSMTASLEAATVGMVGSMPNDIETTRGSNMRSRTRTLTWSPPSHYKECIVGYSVTVTTPGGDALRHSTVPGTSVELSLPVGQYRVRVAAIIKTGRNRSSEGLARSIQLSTKLDWLEATSIVVGVVFLAVAVILSAKFSISYVYKNKAIGNLQDNRILKRAMAMQYVQLTGYRGRAPAEKEVYDHPRSTADVANEPPQPVREEGEDPPLLVTGGDRLSISLCIEDSLSKDDGGTARGPALRCSQPRLKLSLGDLLKSTYSTGDSGSDDDFFDQTLDLATDRSAYPVIPSPTKIHSRQTSVDSGFAGGGCGSNPTSPYQDVQSTNWNISKYTVMCKRVASPPDNPGDTDSSDGERPVDTETNRKIQTSCDQQL